MLTIFIGTVEVSVIAMLIATPLGLGAAMYLSEYASPRTRRRLKPILETLAGIPSVVLGYFALQVINPTIVQNLFSGSGTFTIMAAGIGVGILTIPLVASVAEDAMYAVPGALREAAYGIGARRRTVTTKVVFPAAVSGIMAALILGFSRALGETMVVAIAAGASGGAPRHWSPLDPGQTMTGRDLVARDRVRPGEERDGPQSVRLALLRGPAALRVHARPQPPVGAVRAPRAEGVLMSAIAPTTQVRTTVELALRGSKRDVAGRVFQAALLAVAARCRC